MIHTRSSAACRRGRSFSVRRLRLTLLTAVAALAVVAATATSASAQTSSVVYACIDKSNGDSRLAQRGASSLTRLTAGSSCAGGEYPTKMFWNQTGPQGPQGPMGPQGIQGPRGLQGVKGDT